jgi:hypothetical protein
MLRQLLYRVPIQKLRGSILAMIALSSLPLAAFSQRPVARILRDIDNAERITITGSHSPRANASNDVGRIAPDTRLKGMSLILPRSEAQQAALKTLLKAQQDPSSSSFLKWLSPDEFAAEFGIADHDITKVQTWLEQ